MVSRAEYQLSSSPIQMRKETSAYVDTPFEKSDWKMKNMLWFWWKWLVILRINVDLAIFQPYLDLEAGDNKSLKIQVARPGIEPRPSCSASQELNHSAIAAPLMKMETNSISRCTKMFSTEIIHEHLILVYDNVFDR